MEQITNWNKFWKWNNFQIGRNFKIGTNYELKWISNLKSLDYYIKKKTKKTERRKPKNKIKKAQRAGPLADWVLLPCAEPQIGSTVGAK
jgi:hypothetical protein